MQADEMPKKQRFLRMLPKTLASGDPRFGLRAIARNPHLERSILLEAGQLGHVDKFLNQSLAATI